jgi:probable HAF family extracellular repeat protein
MGKNKITAYADNDSGKVVGSSEISPGIQSPIHAFITDINSNMTDLGTLGGQNSQAFDINLGGQVVGWAETSIANRRHAFLTGPDGEGMADLNSFVNLENGVYLASATGINDVGQIIANASDGRSYLLSPVPEPEIYGMLLAGLGLTGFMARRKKRAI